MESDELRYLEQLGFDEKAETWFVDTSETPRLALTRSTLEALVQLYNRIHHGNPLHLADQKTLHRMKDIERKKDTGAEDRRAPAQARQKIARGDSKCGARRMRRLIARIVPSLLHRRHP